MMCLKFWWKCLQELGTKSKGSTFKIVIFFGSKWYSLKTIEEQAISIKVKWAISNTNSHKIQILIHIKYFGKKNFQ